MFWRSMNVSTFIGGPLGGGCSRRLRLARDKVDNSFDARTAALGSILGMGRHRWQTHKMVLV